MIGEFIFLYDKCKNCSHVNIVYCHEDELDLDWKNRG